VGARLVPLTAIKSIAKLGGMTDEQVDKCLGNRELLNDIALKDRAGYWLFDEKMNELSGNQMPPDALPTILCPALVVGGTAEALPNVL